jgi:DNA-binding PadR family transcriptional regulator
MADDPITRHFFNGFIRLHILYHAAKEPIYGAEITEELIRHGYRLGSGTLYPTLHLLEDLGYLRCRTEGVKGRRRKYHHATPAGKGAGHHLLTRSKMNARQSNVLSALRTAG